MKIKLFFILLLSFLGAYLPTTVHANLIESNMVIESNMDGVLVAGKAFNDTDCSKYLDRDVKSYGYQPIQIIIKNFSDKSIIFSPDQVSLPCAPLEDVINCAHTSTVGRAAGYGVVGWFFLWPLIIPAIVDGVNSYNANRALDSDYFSKSAKRQIIAPNSKMNAIIFVPTGSYTELFYITLKEEGTSNVYKTQVIMY